MSLQAMLAQTQEERNTIAEEYKKTISELTLRQKKVDTATVEERLHNSEIAKIQTNCRHPKSFTR